MIIKFSLHNLVVEDCVQLLFCEVYILALFFFFNSELYILELYIEAQVM
jgi:hypothetical protein